MGELFENTPELTKAAATNPLALAALMAPTLGVPVVYFRH